MSQKKKVERKCRACGCTDNQACREGCAWVESDLCSTCIEQSVAYWLGVRTTLAELLDELQESRVPAILKLCATLEENLERLAEKLGDGPLAAAKAAILADVQATEPASFGKGARTSDTMGDFFLPPDAKGAGL